MIAREIKEETIKAKTGRSTKEWDRIIDEFGSRNHTQIAKFLRENFKVSPWWSQILTNRYEWKKGLRNK